MSKARDEHQQHLERHLGATQATLSSVVSSSNRRIAYSVSAIIALLVFIGFNLYDPIGYSRAWSLISKVLTGQEVNETLTDAGIIHESLKPRYISISQLEDELALIRNRIDLIGTYISELQPWPSRLASSDDASGAFSSFIELIDDLSSLSSPRYECLFSSDAPILGYTYTYQTRQGNIARATAVLQVCMIGGRLPAYSRVDVISADVSDDEDILSQLKPLIDNKSAQKAVERSISLLKREQKDLEVRLLSVNSALSSGTADTVDEISSYIASSKVDIGRDVSFILAKILLTFTLISIAATLLKVILSEIRWTPAKTLAPSKVS